MRFCFLLNYTDTGFRKLNTNSIFIHFLGDWEIGQSELDKFWDRGGWAPCLVGRDAMPDGGDEIRMGNGWVEPAVGCENELFGVGVEPRSPPGEGAVGDDVVVACSHEAKVFVGGGGVVMVDKDQVCGTGQILTCECDVVGEDEEGGVRVGVEDGLDGIAVVADGESIPAVIDKGVVSASDVDGDG